MNNDIQNTTQKTKYRATRTLLKTGWKLRWSGMVGSSCSTCSNRRFTLVPNLVVSHAWGWTYVIKYRLNIILFTVSRLNRNINSITAWLAMKRSSYFRIWVPNHSTYGCICVDFVSLLCHYFRVTYVYRNNQLYSTVWDVLSTYC